MAGLGLDAGEPVAHRRKSREVVIALVRQVGVGVERDVGDGIAVGGEEAPRRQMLLHHPQRAVAFFHPVFQRVALQIAAALDQRQPEIGGADIGLQAVLLEEHPLQHFGAFGAVVGHQRRVPRDVPEDGVRLGDVIAGRHLQKRNVAARIHLEKFGRAGLALQDVDLDQLMRDVELCEREPHLVAIARAAHGIELVHASSPGSTAVPPSIKDQSTAIARPGHDDRMKRINACAATCE